MTETIVMSVGGSLIVPDAIDTQFLSNLKNLVDTHTASGRRFIIIAGGGRTARRYQDAAKAVTTLTSDDLDWMGIHATRINGHLLRTIFKTTAHPVVYHKLDAGIQELTEPVIVCGGAKPGCSSDYVATFYAGVIGAKHLVNLSNTDYVYTDNPKTNPDAQPIEDITWADFRKLIPENWDPGLSSPFDPIAAKEAEKLGIEVAQINGAKLEALSAYLDGKPFVGTRIHH